MKPAAAAGNLRGFSYICFELLLFIHHSPGLGLFERRNELVSLHATIAAKWGTGEFRDRIVKAGEDLDKITSAMEPVEGLDWAVDVRNEDSLKLDNVQRELYAIMGELGILDNAGMRDQMVPD